HSYTLSLIVYCFFLSAPPTSGIYTLSLHDALPICVVIEGDIAPAERDERAPLPAPAAADVEEQVVPDDDVVGEAAPADVVDPEEDRKSTRLNSSHVEISYAVFCLKKKNSINQQSRG